MILNMSFNKVYSINKVKIYNIFLFKNCVILLVNIFPSKYLLVYKYIIYSCEDIISFDSNL